MVTVREISKKLKVILKLIKLVEINQGESVTKEYSA